MRQDKSQPAPEPGPGAPPGTLVAQPCSAHPGISVLAYTEDTFLEQKLESPDQIPDIAKNHSVTWVNVEGLGDVESLQAICDIAGMHKLALEDILSGDHRAKVEDYDDHLFIIVRMVDLQTEPIDIEQLSMYLGKNLLITFQDHPGDCFEQVRDRIRKASGKIRKNGPDYLAYAIIDAIVDAYLPVLEKFGERLEDIETDIVINPSQKLVNEIHRIKSDLLRLRRASWPLREIVNSLIRDQESFITPNTQVYLRDCYDHAIQVVDLVEAYRELCADLMNVYLSSISNRLNEIMKVLTIIATIFMPLSFVAGLYGMNFNTNASRFNMPELNWPLGYFFALGIMAAIALTMLVYFSTKGWIGGGRRK